MPQSASQPASPPVASNGQHDDQHDDRLWHQLTHRDPAASFLYAVLTTGIFCRVGCASRLPRRANVRFFAHADAALAAGFRPCLRCQPTRPAPPASSLAAQVAELLHQHAASSRSGPLPLATLARHTARSRFAIQRAFRAAFSLSPAQYLRRLRAQQLASQLRNQPAQSITDAIYSVGYSSSSRAYTGSPLGMPPGSVRRSGSSETIQYAVAACSLGHALAAQTPRGLCWLALGDSPDLLLADLRAHFHAATLIPDSSLAERLGEVLRHAEQGRALPDLPLGLPLDLHGTAFQMRVWAALRQIPPGHTRSYSELARSLGQPTATRAVARACATNSVALAVPCHRVVASNGSLSGYRWGTERKRTLLATESRAAKPHPSGQP